MATRFFLNSAAAPAAVTAGSGTKKLASLTQGTTSNGVFSYKNTAAGPLSPQQTTDSTTFGADGTVMTWYTAPLGGANLTTPNRLWNLWGKETSTSANSAPLMTVEVVNIDGSSKASPLFFVATGNQGAGEWGTSDAAKNINLGTISSLEIVGGDRFKITVWYDDAADQGGTGNMAAGLASNIKYDGLAGALGDSYFETDANLIALPEPGFLPTARTPITWVSKIRSNNF